MTNLYVTDEKGRNVYYVYNLMTPSGSMIRTIKYDFGVKGHGIAFVARDCLDTLGYKYKDKEPNKAIYQYVSKENVINGRNDTPHDVGGVSDNVYIKTEYHNQIKPVVLITLNGFFELVSRSNMPDAIKFQYWVNNEVLPALYRGENMAINIHNNGGIFEAIDSVRDEAGIPNIRGTQGDQIKEMISNYARLTRRTYPMAFQEFKKAYWNAYHEDISKLEGSGTAYQKIATNGVYDKAKAVLNVLIGQCSNANTGYEYENAAIVSQLTNVINDLSYNYNIYRDLINSDPNYVITDGIPRRRVVRMFSKEQVDAINEYANKHGIDPVKAMHALFD